MRITVSGTPGSGKSTIAKALAEALKFRHYSTGDFMRKLAEDRGLSLAELSRLAEKDPSIDKEIDDLTRSLSKQDNFVMDSRLAFHFLPNSVKVFVKCSPEIATERIFKDALEGRRSAESNIKSYEESLAQTRKRFKSEMQRYKKYYNVDYTDESHYDIIIDTSNVSKQDGINKVISEVKKHLKKSN